MNVRVRFAPSPTGYLHIGGARTALFNYLFAKANKGTFILRIEDTDRSRYVADAEKEIFESLRWLGLSWDEGPEAGGNFGPYHQSQRTELYKKELERLLSSGWAYPCFCTAERLEKVRQEQQKTSGAAGYDRHCRNLGESERAQLLSTGQPHVIRLKIPLGRTVVFNDLIRGSIEYQSDILDDLVLLKSDGFPTYHLANVVDDHHMQISHVLRGDEWIASTPRHVLLYEAFGWTPPQFAHMPVILSPDGGKLSKRKGAVSVMDYKKNGYLPEALFNFLTLLGWAPGDDREKMTQEEIIDAFSVDRISAKGAVLDETKLEWMNGLYMAERSVESIAKDALDIWKEKKWVEESVPPNDAYVHQVIHLLKDRSKKITELTENAFYFFNDPAEYDSKLANKFFKEETLPILIHLTEKMDTLAEFTHASVEEVYRQYSETTQIPGGKLIHPSRLAVSGVGFGPGLFELFEVLGKERVVRRMKKAIEWIEKKK
jgi:glutamyl-tRNA synthetase